jgi:hypothetical protein
MAQPSAPNILHLNEMLASQPEKAAVASIPDDEPRMASRWPMKLGGDIFEHRNAFAGVDKRMHMSLPGLGTRSTWPRGLSSGKSLWLNRVERWFAEFTRKWRGVHSPVRRFENDFRSFNHRTIKILGPSNGPNLPINS